jgi:hypothetical protein
MCPHSRDLSNQARPALFGAKALGRREVGTLVGIIIFIAEILYVFQFVRCALRLPQAHHSRVPRRPERNAFTPSPWGLGRPAPTHKPSRSIFGAFPCPEVDYRPTRIGTDPRFWIGCHPVTHVSAMPPPPKYGAREERALRKHSCFHCVVVGAARCSNDQKTCRSEAAMSAPSQIEVPSARISGRSNSDFTWRSTSCRGSGSPTVCRA